MFVSTRKLNTQYYEYLGFIVHVTLNQTLITLKVVSYSASFLTCLAPFITQMSVQK